MGRVLIFCVAGKASHRAGTSFGTDFYAKLRSESADCLGTSQFAMRSIFIDGIGNLNVKCAKAKILREKREDESDNNDAQCAAISDGTKKIVAAAVLFYISLSLVLYHVIPASRPDVYSFSRKA